MLRIIRHKFQNLISDEKFSEILQGSVWALGAKIISIVLALITNIIIARVYGAEVLGAVALLMSFLTLATIFTLVGTKSSILRLIPEHLTKYSASSAFMVYRKTQYMVAAISLITGSIFFLCSGFIADTIFSKPHLKFYFSLAAAFIVFKSLMLLSQQAVRGLRLIRVFAFMQLLPELSKLIILVLITLFLFNQYNPVYAMFFSLMITALVGVWIMDRAFKERTSINDTINNVRVKDIISLSLPMLMSTTMVFIIGETGVIMLGIFRPEAEVGYYAVAVKMAALTAFILHAVNSIAAPKFSELYHSDKIDELFYIAKKSTKLIFWITTPILLIFVILGKPILHLIFGSEFAVAYLPLLILVLGQFVNCIAGANATFMNMTGNQYVLRNILFAAALSNIGINMLFTPVYGIYGAAIAAMVSVSGWNIATLIYIKIKFGKTTGYFPKIA